MPRGADYREQADINNLEEELEEYRQNNSANSAAYDFLEAEINKTQELLDLDEGDFRYNEAYLEGLQFAYNLFNFL